MKYYTLIRHAYTGVAEKKQVPSDDLDSLGLEQTEKLTTHLHQHEHIGRVIASPYQRALSTAKYIAEMSNKSLQVEDRLKEIELWIDPNDVKDDTSEEYLRGLRILDEAKHKIHHFLHDINGVEVDGNTIIVAHGNIIRALIGYTLNMNLETIVRMKIDHSSITKIRLMEEGSEPFYQLILFNDTNHLNKY